MCCPEFRFYFLNLRLINFFTNIIRHWPVEIQSILGITSFAIDFIFGGNKLEKVFFLASGGTSRIEGHFKRRFHRIIFSSYPTHNRICFHVVVDTWQTGFGVKCHLEKIFGRGGPGLGVGHFTKNETFIFRILWRTPLVTHLTFLTPTAHLTSLSNSQTLLYIFLRIF